jgi:hypothetical protein
VSKPHRDDGTAWVLLAALLCAGAIVVTAIASEGGRPPFDAPIAMAFDWQAALGLRQPWRLWTSAWVHWSGAHLAVNIAGALVVAFVGSRARLPAAAAVAWALAWPLTQVLLAAVGSERLGAAMPHYGGLSGVLHAGVIVLGLALAWPPAAVRARSPASRARADTGFVATRASAIEPSRITEGPWAMTEMGTATALPASTLEQASPALTGPSAERPLRERWIGVAIVAGTLAKVLLEAPWQLAPRPSAALGVAVAPVAHGCGVVAGLLAWAGWRLLARRPR